MAFSDITCFHCLPPPVAFFLLPCPPPLVYFYPSTLSNPCQLPYHVCSVSSPLITLPFLYSWTALWLHGLSMLTPSYVRSAYENMAMSF